MHSALPALSANIIHRKECRFSTCNRHGRGGSVRHYTTSPCDVVYHARRCRCRMVARPQPRPWHCSNRSNIYPCRPNGYLHRSENIRHSTFEAKGPDVSTRKTYITLNCGPTMPCRAENWPLQEKIHGSCTTLLCRVVRDFSNKVSLFLCYFHYADDFFNFCTHRPAVVLQ